MARNLTWVFELLDKFSGPGTNIINTIKGIQSAMSAANKVKASGARATAKKLDAATGIETSTKKITAAETRKAAQQMRSADTAVKQAQKELLAKLRLENKLQRMQGASDRRQIVSAQKAIASHLRIAKLHGRNADAMEARSRKMFAEYNSGFAGTVRRIFSGTSAIDRSMRTLATNLSSSGSSGWRSWSRSAFYAFSNVNMAYDALKSAMSGPLAVGMEAIEAASFRDMSLAVMETYLPDGKDAAEVYEKIVGFAEQLRVPTKEVELTFARMLAAGFRLSEVPIAFQGISDVIRGAGLDAQETIGFLSRALGQIKGRAQLNAQDFKQITEQITVAGVGEKDVYAAVASKIGMPAQDLMKQLDEGAQIESSLAVYGIFDAIRTRLARKTGKLGTVTQRMSDSPMNMMKFVASKPFDLFREMGQTEGMQAFVGAMENILYLTSSTTVEGKALKKTIEDITSSGFMAIFGSFKGEDGRQRMLGFFNKMLELIQGLQKIFGPVFTAIATIAAVLAPMFDGMFSALIGILPILGALAQGFIMAFMPLTTVLGFVIGKVGELLQWLGQFESMLWVFKVMGVLLGIIGMALVSIAVVMGVITAISAVLASPWVLIAAGIFAVIAAIGWLIDKYKQLGEAGISGLISGWLSGKGAVQSAGAEVVGSLATGVAEAQDSHSPSQLFRKYGMYASEGYAMGVEEGGNKVDRSFAAMADPGLAAGKENKVGAAGTRQVVYVTVSNHVEVGSTDEAGLEKMRRMLDVEMVPRLRAALNAELAGG